MPIRLKSTRAYVLTSAAAIALLSSSAGGSETIPSFNLYGAPGLVDMPTARVAPDATLSTTIAHSGNQLRSTLNFQITPRLSGSFRYSGISDLPITGSVDDVFYDRSFDLRFQLVRESTYIPSVVVGLQDFIGTGLYGGEYVVATKQLAPGLEVTGGLGWGRLGSHNPFASTGERPSEVIGTGGVPTYDRWFRGDVAGFGGVSYSPNSRLTFKAEYSSDAYVTETRHGSADPESNINFGVDYRFRNGAQLSLYHVNGNEIGAQFSIHTNPKKAPVPGGAEAAPVPVAPRAPGARADLGWVNTDKSSYRTTLAKAMKTDGLLLEGLKLEPTRAYVRVQNPTYGQIPQAIGRTARSMTRVLPGSVETFVIVPVQNGMPLLAITLQRSDLEALEHEDNAEILARTQIKDGFGIAPAAAEGVYPQFSWSISPYLQLSMFDPENPLRADLGVRAKAKVHITPSIVASGSVTKKLAGNLDSIDRVDDDALPLVRTEKARYSAEGDPAIEHLTLSHYGRPGRNLYSRVTVGYLETMYAGASAELLWKPVNSRLALGAELNYVKPRDFDQLFGLRSSETRTGTIPDFNGHVSAYYAFGNGFHGQLDVGRYLAGDYGATVSVDREFVNGWRVGAYATFTNVPFEDFGEGSFDKGIRFEVPLSLVTGKPSKTVLRQTIRPIQRDGGARLNVDNRLHRQVRDYRGKELRDSWGRYLR